jgi:hypothetical protein
MQRLQSCVPFVRALFGTWAQLQTVQPTVLQIRGSRVTRARGLWIQQFTREAVGDAVGCQHYQRDTKCYQISFSRVCRYVDEITGDYQLELQRDLSAADQTFCIR